MVVRADMMSVSGSVSPSAQYAEFGSANCVPCRRRFSVARRETTIPPSWISAPQLYVHFIFPAVLRSGTWPRTLQGSVNAAAGPTTSDLQHFFILSTIQILTRVFFSSLSFNFYYIYVRPSFKCSNENEMAYLLIHSLTWVEAVHALWLDICKVWNKITYQINKLIVI